MYRGTTPTLTFTSDMDLNQVDKLEISFAQKEKVVFSKGFNDCNIDKNTISVTLEEEETLLFNNIDHIEIQLRIGIGESRLVSDIIVVPVGRILQEGLLK